MSDNDNTGNGDNREDFPRRENIYLEDRVERLREDLERVTKEHRETGEDILNILKATAEKLVELEQRTLSQNNKLDQNFDELYNLINQFLNKMQETVDTEQDRKKRQEDITEIKQHLKKTNNGIDNIRIFSIILCLLILLGLFALSY